MQTNHKRALWWMGFLVLVALSVSTGAVKLARMPAEMELFRGAGVPDGATLAFGVVQLVLGLALLPARTRRLAAGGMAVTFALATLVVVLNAMWAFALGSLTFIALAAAVARWPEPARA